MIKVKWPLENFRSGMREDFRISGMIGLSAAYDHWVLENRNGQSETEAEGQANATIDTDPRLLRPAKGEISSLRPRQLGKVLPRFGWAVVHHPEMHFTLDG